MHQINLNMFKLNVNIELRNLMYQYIHNFFYLILKYLENIFLFLNIQKKTCEKEGTVSSQRVGSYST